MFSGANSYFSNSAVCVSGVDINKLKLDENNGKVITGGGQKVNLTIDSNRMISRIEVVRSDDQHNVMPSVGAVSSYVSDMRNVGGGVNLWELNISLQAAVQATRFGLGATTHQDNSGHGADASTYASGYTSERSYTPHSYTMPGGSRSTSNNNSASGQTGTDRVAGLGLNAEYSGNQTPYVSGSDSAGSANNSRPYSNTQYYREPNPNAYAPGGQGARSSNRGNAARNDANRPTGATPTSLFARGPLEEFETLLANFHTEFTGSVETRNEFLKEHAQKLSELSSMISQSRNLMRREHYADLLKALTGAAFTGTENTPSKSDLKRQRVNFHTDRLLRSGDVHAQGVEVQLGQLSRIVNTICENLASR